VNLPGISTIYGLLNLSIGQRDPRGRGEVRVRLEGDALEITRLHYVNRGADITASLRVHDVWKGGESPIRGLAAGSIRPPRYLDVPFLDVEGLLSALQAGAASVQIEGTLAEREVRVVPFSEIAGQFTRILTGRPE
jgi:hypothetical protein